MMHENRLSTIFFSFIKPKNYSGQYAASELIINSFSTKGMKCIPITLYAQDRNQKNLFLRYYKLFREQIRTFPNLVKLALFHKPILNLNLGQSFWSFIRIAVWYFPIRLLNRDMRVITSLHGSIFLLWEPEAFITRFFIAFLNSSRIVTVLGETQKNRLMQLGLSSDKIWVVPNTCNMHVVTDSFITEKHTNTKSTINLLHLSLLIESKGFPLYLEALEILAKMDFTQPVRAILCGTIASTSYCKQFKNAEDKRKWIEKRMALINQASKGRLTIEWIQGASGNLKQKLFEESHIFILPTKFPVEAQPIVLLEALSTGCSIITSTAGEIPNTLNRDCAIFLEKLEPQILANELCKLIDDSKTRWNMAINGIKLIRGPLSLDSHIASWERIFNEMMN